MSPYGLSGPFFPYYRTTDETDELCLQFLLIHWRTGTLTPAEEEMAREFDMVRKTIPVR